LGASWRSAGAQFLLSQHCRRLIAGRCEQRKQQLAFSLFDLLQLRLLHRVLLAGVIQAVETAAGK
jgi:hypothetical protein